MSVISKKICLLGDFSVGKTSLVRRFVENKFSDQYLTTVGVNISRKTLVLDSVMQQINLILWDIEGHTKIRSIIPNYLEGAIGAIIVGDLTRQETLTRLNSHLDFFLKINPQGIAVIALNKIDLVSEEKLNKLLTQHSFNSHNNVIETYATSAKMGTDVNQMFHQLAGEIFLGKGIF